MNYAVLSALIVEFAVLMVLFFECGMFGIFFEWVFLTFKFNFFFGNMVFGFMLMVVVLSILCFSTYYMEGEINMNYFIFMLMLFVGSMFFLSFSNSVMAVLLSWDFLGVTSFFLVLFYNNWDSNSGAVNTVLTNRLGDYFVFIFFCFSLFFNFSLKGLYSFMFLFMVMIILGGFTKSAQFPFSGWLPKAMSAPTPVSALVHSSTLVTAGIILIMMFDVCIMKNSISMSLMLGGLLTMLMSSLSALSEEDVKKIVALSTLSQMGFTMLNLGLGFVFLGLVHLLSHAFFKSCLFIQVGILIHNSYNSQDGRGYNNKGSFSFLVQLQLLVTLVCLCGLLFSSGMISKDMILEFWSFNIFSVIFNLVFILAVFLTFIYCFRLLKYFFFNFNNINYFCMSMWMEFCSFLLFFFSLVFLWWVNYNFFFLGGGFNYVDGKLPLIYCLMFIVIIFFFFKYVLFELKYKFLGDFMPKYMIMFFFDLKFFDLSVENFINSVMAYIFFSGYLINLMFKNFSFNMMIVVFFLFFFL